MLAHGNVQGILLDPTLNSQ